MERRAVNVDKLQVCIFTSGRNVSLGGREELLSGLK